MIATNVFIFTESTCLMHLSELLLTVIASDWIVTLL